MAVQIYMAVTDWRLVDGYVPPMVKRGGGGTWLIHYESFWFRVARPTNTQNPDQVIYLYVCL
jgi:hypothetical protein